MPSTHQEGVKFDATTSVTLQWSASDVDNDIEKYIVYFSTNNPPETNIGETTDTIMAVTVVASTTYYWKIKAKDLEGNISSSEIF